MIWGQDRQELRRMYADAWRKAAIQPDARPLRAVSHRKAPPQVCAIELPQLIIDPCQRVVRKGRHTT